jgi:hypothetical protein
MQSSNVYTLWTGFLMLLWNVHNVHKLWTGYLHFYAMYTMYATSKQQSDESNVSTDWLLTLQALQMFNLYTKK